ncbi:MurR/RpiR family transcriptional regulator [Nonomuraea sp. MCN248]|uniref:MurR/RpiR family transcriptional regulator n=1 Tax=Nonomuraea corallina TaxID=2989783 RepID=A0ABT4SJT0_9ACTN|nr:MurR/RpiR family transcriptional regulator [Nonomuraea corallina]MDA0637384.1 MurR/RpiR family transcriptional regulator [Nonomuraea corallina]
MNLLGRIGTVRHELPGALRRVSDAILENPAATARLTIVDLAERSGTSTATVTRLCRVLGFGGYAELRIALAAETGRDDQWADVGREILPGDSLEKVLGVVAGNDLRLLRETAGQLDLASVEKAAQAIARAGRVLLFGASGGAAGAMERRLQRTGIPTWSRSDVPSALTDAALLGYGDVAVGVSHSGRTREAVEVLEEAGGHGATTVAVTSNPRSPLAEVAELVLTTTSRETTFRSAGSAAFHSQLLVLDVLYVAVAQRTYERTRPAFDVTARAVAAE